MRKRYYHFPALVIMRIFLALISLLWGGVLVVRAGPVHYVAHGGQPVVPNYESWDTAASNIQDAIDVAGAPDTVWVSNGVYNVGLTKTPSYSLSNRVCIIAAITLRSFSNNPTNTIIEGAVAVGGDADANGLGSNAVRCVYLSGGASLIGFTLTNGRTFTTGGGVEKYDRNGGGIILDTNCVVSNCIIVANKANSYGGGASLINGTMNNCLLVGNYSKTYGGGATIDTDAKVNNCTLTGNTAGNYAGGATMGARVILNNCVISNNTSGYGPGGIGTWYGGTMNNCLVVGNRVTSFHPTASAAGGIACWDLSDVNPPTLNNCTVVNNRSQTNGGGIFFVGTTHTNTMNNCIVWGNTCVLDSNSSNIYKTSSTVTVNNTCSGPVQLGTGNIAFDPLFANTNIGNYRLIANSPCINMGINQNWMTNAVDPDGRRRIDYFSSHVDMGCYEHLPMGTMFKVP